MRMWARVVARTLYAGSGRWKPTRRRREYHSSPDIGHTTFTVLHWNVLASYLGKNTNPWFLHGIGITPERRNQIYCSYYERDHVTNELKNAGWPSFAKGILTEDEQTRIEEIDGMVFSWPKRLEKIKQLLTLHRTDVVSLVELDAFEDVHKHLTLLGYAGEFVARPRLVSKDGCGIFWHKKTFSLINKSKVVYVDAYQPDPKKDRCAILVLLQHKRTNQLVVVASTHLARDMQGKAPRDSVRARQLGELAAHLRTFMETAKVNIRECPVILCGDVNANSMAKLTGLVQVSALMSAAENAKRLHPIVFATKAVDTGGATSRTEAREERVDAIMYTAALADAQNLELSRTFEKQKKVIIPNELIPSDHFPLLAQIGVLTPIARVANVVRKWWSVVLPSSRRPRSAIEKQLIESDPWITDAQLDADELRVAFNRIDTNRSGRLEVEDVLKSMENLDLLCSLSRAIRTKLMKESLFGPPFSEGKGLDFVDFCALYFLAHPVCERCANVAFDHIDVHPRNDFINEEELAKFFKPFDQSPLQGNAAEVFRDAHARGMVDEKKGLGRSAFKLLLGARFVETMFEDEELRERILKRMGASKRQE